MSRYRFFQEAVTDYLPASEHVKQTAHALRKKVSGVSSAVAQKVYSEAVDQLLEAPARKQIKQIKQIAQSIGADKVDLEQLRRGIEVEKEHGDRDKKTDVIKGKDSDSTKTFGKIALAHLKEIPDYYTRLDKMEKEGKAAVKEAVDRLLGEAVTDYMPAAEHVKDTAKAIKKKAAKLSSGLSRLLPITVTRGQVPSALGKVSLGRPIKKAWIDFKQSPFNSRTVGQTYPDKSMWINPKHVNRDKHTLSDVLTHEYVHSKDPSLKIIDQNKHMLTQVSGQKNHDKQWFHDMRHGIKKANRLDVNAERLAYSVGDTTSIARRFKEHGVPLERVHNNLRRGRLAPKISLTRKHEGIPTEVLTKKQLVRHKKKMLKNAYMVTQKAYSEEIKEAVDHLLAGRG